MATLIIGDFHSRCGACFGNADPEETAHHMTRMRGDGCGATYTAVSDDFPYTRCGETEVREMRPDLPYLAPGGDA